MSTSLSPLLAPMLSSPAMRARVTVHLSADRIAKLFEPMAYQGVSQALIDRLLASLDDKQNT